MMCNEGCDQGNQGNGCPTRDPLTRLAPVHQLSLCSGAFAHPSLARLLRCFAVKTIAVSENELEDELEEVVILTDKPRQLTSHMGTVPTWLASYFLV